MEPPKRVALYARVSTVGQAERDLSIPEQFAAMERFCDERGWVVAARYKDAGVSGATQTARPQFLAMVRRAMAKDHPFDLILTRDASRFGRGDEDPVMRASLRAANVGVDNIESPSGDMHARLTPGAKFVETVKNAADTMQREEIPARVIASQRAKARNGGLPGQQGTCFGYRSVWDSDGLNSRPRRRVEPDPVNSRVVQEMFRRYLLEGSIKAVTAWLNESGIEPPGNGKRRAQMWYDTTVRGILANESLLGRLVYGKLTKVLIPGSARGSKRNVLNTETPPVRVDGAFPAIIDQETFNRVQARLNSNVRVVAGIGNPGNVLRGIGKCLICGWRLAHQIHSSSGRWYYMCGRVKMHHAKKCDPRCSGILYASYVDEVVDLFVRNTILTPHYEATLRTAVRRYNDAARGFEGVGAFALLDEQIAKVAARVENLVSQVRRTGSPALADALVAEEHRLAHLRKKRTEIEASVRVQQLDELAIVRSAKAVRRALRAGDRSQIKALLPDLVSAVEVDWSKRKSPPVAFSYRYALAEDLQFQQDLREGARLSPPSQELIDMANAAVARLSRADFEEALDEAAEELSTGKYQRRLGTTVEVTHAAAPLTFVAKWDMTNIERIATDAVERLGRALVVNE